MRNKKYTKIALVLSFALIVAWCVMGTGTSLAWFTDTDEEVKNIFHFADFEVLAEYRDDKGNWKTIEGDTHIFDDQALYEPGYTQVVYLRVTNKGSVPFDYKTAVSVTDYTTAFNVFGQEFHLLDYLFFGLTPAMETEADMDALVASRQKAAVYATMPLCSYSTVAEELKAGKTVYMALVIHMPETVGNAANYWKCDAPRVELGLIVTATQQHDN